jgi:hypothetical protein
MHEVEGLESDMLDELSLDQLKAKLPREDLEKI